MMNANEKRNVHYKMAAPDKRYFSITNNPSALKMSSEEEVGRSVEAEK